MDYIYHQNEPNTASATGNFYFVFLIYTANSNEGSLVLGKLEGNSETESFSSPKVYGDFAGVTGKMAGKQVYFEYDFIFLFFYIHKNTII